MSLLSLVNRETIGKFSIATFSLLVASTAWGQITQGTPGVDVLVPGGNGNQYIGIAASPSLVVFTRPFCQVGNVAGSNPREVLQLNGNGSVSLFGLLPDIPFNPSKGSGGIGSCFENYIAISPSSNHGWTIGDVFVATANPVSDTSVDVWRYSSVGAAPHAGTLFGTYAGVNPQGSGLFGGHSGVGFDNVGTWNNNLLLGGANGITVIDSTGAIVTTIPNPTGDADTVFESIRVAPAGFDGGLHGGWIFGQTDNVASGTNHGVWAFGPPGCAGAACTAFNAVTGATAPQGESINFVPPALCGFTVNNTQYSYFMSLFDATTNNSTPDTTNPAAIDGISTAAVIAFPTPANAMLIQDENDGTIKEFISSGTSFSPFFQYLTPPGVDQEDAAIVACPAPPPQGGGCPATQGFWHKACNWPAVTINIDGVQYNGGTDKSMVIGGFTYSQTELLSVMPSGSLHPGNYGNSLSNLIAAVLNLAAGAQDSPAVDTAIANANGALTGHPIFCPPNNSKLCSGSFQTIVQSDLTALNNYNQAVGLSCSEANGLKLGSCH